MNTSPTSVILDADNTLYDWVHYFATTMRTAVVEIHNITAIPMRDIEKSLRDVFLRRGTVEYAHYLSDLVSNADVELTQSQLGKVIELCRNRSEDSLRLYPGIQLGMDQLQSSGRRLICMSDSSAYSVLSRLERTGILRYFAFVFCTPDYPSFLQL